MSGHNHWTGIKHKKEITDQKRGRVFSKLLAAITAAARAEPNPEFNPRLRTTIQKAKGANVPLENIGRAISKAGQAGGDLEELVLESYGPGGAALLIEALTDNKNRTVAEVKKILSDHGAKLAEPGSVRWAFSQLTDQRGLDADSCGNWRAKFPQTLNEHDQNKLRALVEFLEEREDVQNVYTNKKL